MYHGISICRNIITIIMKVITSLQCFDLILFIERQEGHTACKKLGVGLLAVMI